MERLLTHDQADYKVNATKSLANLAVQSDHKQREMEYRRQIETLSEKLKNAYREI